MQVSTAIDQCRICQSDALIKVLDLGDQPPANSLRRNKDQALPSVPLCLVFCEKCSTIQLTHTVDPEYLFDNYVWVTGTSSTALSYSDTFCSNVLDRLQGDSDTKPFIVEIASNDGTFLQKFKEKGCKVIGVDPAKNIAAIAEQNGIPTISDFFNKSVTARIKNEHGNPTAVIARNVIPHVKEIHSIIELIADLIGENKIGIIEFHYAQKILDELHYDSIYHEHLFYFSLKTLGGLLKQYGLNIFDVHKSPISGGSLVIYFSKSEISKTTELVELESEEESLKLNDLAQWQKFGRASQDHAKELVAMVKKAKEKGRVIGYGASARSSTLLNFCGISAKELDSIIDKNDLKHGCITPGSNIEIIPLTKDIDQFEDLSAIVMLAWNFEKEIETELRSLGYTGPIIMPLPNAPRTI